MEALFRCSWARQEERISSTKSRTTLKRSKATPHGHLARLSALLSTRFELTSLTEFNVDSNTARPMDALTNSFCAVRCDFPSRVLDTNHSFREEMY